MPFKCNLHRYTVAAAPPPPPPPPAKVPSPPPAEDTLPSGPPAVAERWETPLTEEFSEVGLRKLRIQSTLSLKAPGFNNPCNFKVISWFS